MEESLTSEDGLASDILEGLGQKPPDIRTLSPLALAWLGDTVFDLIVRTYIVSSGSTSPDRMQKRSSGLVSARAQSAMLKDIDAILSDEEKDIIRRGRNAKPKTKAKNATHGEYHKATGFETLIGYLYLKGRLSRCIELVGYAVTETEDAK